MTSSGQPSGQQTGHPNRGAEAMLRAVRSRGTGADSLTADAANGLTDNELMARLADGDADALGPLYGRYVRLVFGIASQTLDHSASEDLVQEVFLVVWRKAGTFDSSRGSFKGWLLEIVHTRVLNELRRRSRRPRLLPDQGDDQLRLLADPTPEPIESVVRGQRAETIDDALAALPDEQQRALRLAFFSEMTHEQVAATTAVPLGTAKSRIRTGLKRLRSHLQPLLVGALAIAIVSGAAVYQREHEDSLRNARALQHVTMSDVQGLRLTAIGSTPPDAHGNYRAREGADIAVLTVSNMPPLQNGTVYQAWARIDGRWRSLGVVPPLTPDGHGLLIVEGADLGATPEVIQVTEEPAGGSSTPSARVVIAWPGP